MKSLKVPVFTPVISCLLSLCVFAVHGSDLSDTQESVHCVSLQRIDNIKIIDKQNIIVKTRGDKYFLNHLSHECPNLTEDKAIMYKTPLNRLCSHDIITVLDNIGGGFQQLGSCGLGKFKPITEEELKLLKEGSL